MKGLCLSGVFAAILGLGAGSAFAQNVIGAKSGIINWVEGDVFLNDQPYVMQPSQFGEVKENMVLRAGEGRAEVLLPPGVFFRVAENSSFKMISNRLIDTRVELLKGSAIMEIDDLAKEATVTLVCKNGTISLNKPGIYRFDSEPARIKVFKGTADVALAGDQISVSAGKMLLLGGAVASAEKFDVAETDSFDHWSHRRGEVLANANISAAKQANGSSGGSTLYAGVNPCYGGYGGYGPGVGMGTGTGIGVYARPWGTWGYNPYYGMGTYIPCQGTLMSPYGFQYWSPFMAYQAFFSPYPLYTFNGGGGYRGGTLASSTTAGPRGISRSPSGLSTSGVGNGGTFSRAAGGSGGGGGMSAAPSGGGGMSASHGGGGGGAGGHGK